MRGLLVAVVCVVVMGAAAAGENARKPDKSGQSDKSERGPSDKAKGNDKHGKKEHKDNGAGPDKGANGKSGQVPPGIAKQGEEKAAKWKASRGQLGRDLDDVYDRDDARRGDKEARKGRAAALYDALTDAGLEPEDARGFVGNMALTGDKDQTFADVAEALARVRRARPDTRASDIKTVVDAAADASGVREGLRRWVDARLK